MTFSSALCCMHIALGNNVATGYKIIIYIIIILIIQLFNIIICTFVYTAPVPDVEKTVPDCHQTVQGV